MDLCGEIQLMMNEWYGDHTASIFCQRMYVCIELLQGVSKRHNPLALCQLYF